MLPLIEPAGGGFTSAMSGALKLEQTLLGELERIELEGEAELVVSQSRISDRTGLPATSLCRRGRSHDRTAPTEGSPQAQ
jgi:hypothetical protein